MRRAFTLVELLVVIVVVSIVAAITSVVVFGSRQQTRQSKDAAQIRGILQSLPLYCNSNGGDYPLPSRMEPGDSGTVKLAGRAKDTTANIFSILIFNGNCTPEMFVSPLEVNPQIRVCSNYQFASPTTAVDPTKANWDPSFNADFAGGKIGNVSYAHLQPSDGRKKKWFDSFSPTEAVVGNRAPEIASVTADDAGKYSVSTRITNSNTLRIHGSPISWEGNIAFNDGHIEFVDTLAPDAAKATYDRQSGQKAPDCYFFDEPDDKDGSNLYLGIWTTAGERAQDFKGVWD